MVFHGEQVEDVDPQRLRHEPQIPQPPILPTAQQVGDAFSGKTGAVCQFSLPPAAATQLGSHVRHDMWLHLRPWLLLHERNGIRLRGSFRSKLN